MPASNSGRPWRSLAATAKRLIVVTVGFTLCGAGLIMLVLPGPGILVVFAGLVVLATAYSWAERPLERTRTRAVDATSRLQSGRVARAGVATSATALITGGAAVAVIVDGHRYLGVSVLGRRHRSARDPHPCDPTTHRPTAPLINVTGAPDGLRDRPPDPPAT